MAERIRNLKSGLPQTRIPERDPWALRAVVGLLFVIAFAFSGGPLGGRISDAFRSHSGSNVVPPRIDAWVTPPRYTGRAPLFLTSAANTEEKQFTVPQDSTLIIRIIGGSGSEKVTLTSIDGRAANIEAKDQGKADDAAAAKSKPRNFEVLLGANSTVALSGDGTANSAWSFSVIPDQPPSIRFTKDPVKRRQRHDGSLLRTEGRLRRRERACENRAGRGLRQGRAAALQRTGSAPLAARGAVSNPRK